MNSRIERYVWAMLAILASMAILAYISVHEWGMSESMALSLTCIMGIVVLFGFGWYLKERLREKGMGIPTSDERTVAMEGIAFKYAFLSSFWAIIALAWYNILMRYTGKDQMPADIAIVAALAIMALTWVISSYVSRKRIMITE